jgi:hypothetical protein
VCPRHHAKVKWLLDDPVLERQFKDYVEKHGEVKGSKNMTMKGLLDYTNNVIFKFATLTPLLTKPVCIHTIWRWLQRCGFSYEGHVKAKFKDGALSDEVLNRLYDEVLPFWEQKVKEGMLSPDDFNGVTDEDDEGWSEQAYEKARLRAVAFEGDADALPWLAWSHDEACADSMDAQWRAWVAKGQARLRSKGNSGKKLMAAEFVSIIGNGQPRLTDAEFVAAKAAGYSGPQAALLLMEIGGKDENMAENIETYEGGDDLGDSELSVQLEAKIFKMQAAPCVRLCCGALASSRCETVRFGISTLVRWNFGSVESWVR